MNLTPLGSRFRSSSSSLMRSHLAPCRPLRSLRLAHASAVRALAASASMPVPVGVNGALPAFEPRRV